MGFSSSKAAAPLASAELATQSAAASPAATAASAAVGHGCYVSMKVAPLSAKAIHDWCIEHKVPSPTSEDDLQATIIASKVPFSPKGASEFTTNGKHLKRLVAAVSREAGGAFASARIVTGDKLVVTHLWLLLDSPDLAQRHEQAKQAGGEDSFGPWLPHITVSTHWVEGTPFPPDPVFDQVVLLDEHTALFGQNWKPGSPPDPANPKDN